jgi:hypothetical protein
MTNRDPSPSRTPVKGSRERAFSPALRYVRASGPPQPTEMVFNIPVVGFAGSAFQWASRPLIDDLSLSWGVPETES